MMLDDYDYLIHLHYLPQESTRKGPDIIPFVPDDDLVSAQPEAMWWYGVRSK